MHKAELDDSQIPGETTDSLQVWLFTVEQQVEPVGAGGCAGLRPREWLEVSTALPRTRVAPPPPLAGGWGVCSQKALLYWFEAAAAPSPTSPPFFFFKN